MKILAINLPQFHSIPENDAWWGRGFTEWTNVRSARPLADWHYQPVEPLNDYYYDMTEPDTLVWQHKLAKEYGIDGFIYYHYWFNGKLLLQKPLELLLHTPEANREFCLCWANESWTRAWDGKSSETIMEQTFGGFEDWVNHIDYLLHFFRDQRYIKKGNRPVLFVYSPNRIPRFSQMVDCWNKALRRNGFDGIYVIEYLSSFNPTPVTGGVDAVMEFEPLYSAHYQISCLKRLKRYFNKKMKCTDILDYDYLWSRLLDKSKTYSGKSIVKSCFTNFDNTPRKGVSGFITRGAEPARFSNYFFELLCKRRENELDYVAINAWNEWGEGAILEPTTKDGYKWLEAVRDARVRYDAIQKH